MTMRILRAKLFQEFENGKVLNSAYTKLLIEGIGKHIRKEREKSGLSQELLAFDCAMERNFIARLERAEKDVRFGNLAIIFRELGIKFSDIDKIITEVEEQFSKLKDKKSTSADS